MAESDEVGILHQRIATLERSLAQFRRSEAAVLNARNDLENRFEQLVLVQEFSRDALGCGSSRELVQTLVESAISILRLEIGLLWQAKEGGHYELVASCNMSGAPTNSLPQSFLPPGVTEGKIVVAPMPTAWETQDPLPVLSKAVWLPLSLRMADESLLLILGIPKEKEVFYPPLEQVDMRICRLLQQQAEAVYAYFLELERRKLSDLLAQKSSASFRSLFEDAPLPLIEIDASSLRKAVDRQPHGCWPSMREVLKAAGEVSMKNVNQAARDFYGSYRKEKLRKLTRETSLKMLGRHFKSAHDTLMTGKAFVHDGVQQTARGEREVQYHVSVLSGYDQDWARLLVALIDTTEVNAAQRERDEMAKRLKRSEKMEALGLLAGGVAHDLNNVLVSLVGFPDLLMEQVKDRPDAYEMATVIRDAGVQASAFVQDLLTMARQGLQAQERMNINDVVRAYIRTRSVKILCASHPDVRLDVDLAPDPLHVVGSAAHLTKLVMNLLTNGFEAIQGEGVFRLQSRSEILKEEKLGYEKIDPGTYVVLEFEDNGSGISQANLSRIFEPFFTRKTMGQLSGTGLGMAVVWGVIRDHSGFIDIDTEVGRGTRFTIYLPMASPPPEEKKAALPPVASARGESILVVDDIKEQRLFLRTVLERYGYSVTCAASGEEAVDWLRDNHADMVLLDMIMDPGIDGLDTYEQMIRIKPEQPAILVSGYAESERVRRVLDLGIRTLLKKPFRPIELVSVLQKELE